MLRRLLARLSSSFATLLGTAILTFALVNVVPGDVARVIAGPKASPAVLKAIRTRLHLDEPMWRRLGHHLWDLAHGDLGHSFATDQPVAQAILTRLPTTIALSVVAIVLWMAVAVPVGVLTAKFRGSWFDRTVLVLATLSLSLPSFWLARMLQYGMSYRLGWFPVAGFRGFAHLLLPGAALAILTAGYYARLIHSNLLEVLGSPYIRAARAKGASEASVLFLHALRNALVPVVTVLGMDVAGLLGGAMFVENVFALPGIGTLAVQSVFSLDVPVIMGTVMLSAVIVVAANLAVDVLYGWLDPRIRGGT
jgi:peptide/nickel transport system permease protein